MSQLTEDEAVRLLHARLGRFPSPVEVRVAGRGYTIWPQRAGVWIDYRAAVRRALARHEQPGFVERAWRELTSRRTATHQRAAIHAEPRAVRAAVGRLARAVRRARRDASLEVTLTTVHVRRGHAGMRLVRPRRVARRVLAAFRDRHAAHSLRASVRRIPPRVTRRDVRRRHPVVVTVSRRERLVRVFRSGRLVERHRARAGHRGRRTPAGRFTVRAVRRHPAAIRFHGAVGFRPRSRRAPRSAAAAASVRMRPRDLRALRRQVRVGTTVLVAG